MTGKSFNPPEFTLTLVSCVYIVTVPQMQSTETLSVTQMANTITISKGSQVGS